MLDKTQDHKRVITFPSDKNGCGFYRNIIPLNYCLSHYNWDVTFLFQFVFDLNLVQSSSVIRFQRQCTENQHRCISSYRKCISQTRSNAKIMYELDDLVHGIEPNNIMAYQYYTPTRKHNVVEIMKMSDRITFSTEFLAKFYREQFGIHHSVVIPNYLPKFMWSPNYSSCKRPLPHECDNNKPVILWAGSASHVGPGGDLEFLFPLIEATTDEFTWLFVGVCPPKLKNKVKTIGWSHFYDYPLSMQNIKADIAIAPISDSVFNYAKSDLKYLEYAAMNIPSILSKIGNGSGPYDKTNSPNLVENDIDSWYQAILSLLENENKYAETIKLQHDYLNNRWLENNIDIYKNTFLF
jgi:glycosyltransferase involved in cell wall biosynthesis